MSDPIIVLREGREKSVRLHHPWIFASAIRSVEPEPEAGMTVLIKSEKGEEFGLASYSPGSQIRARMWTWDSQEKIDKDYFAKRIRNAIELREKAGVKQQTNAYRLVHGESDGLPGLIVDRYNNILVVQILTTGIEFHRKEIIDLLAQISGIVTIYERSDVDVRELEGLKPVKGLLWGEPILGPIIIEENGLKFEVDLEKGQKTGFFIDQRENRELLRKYVASKAVLNCFCYTGAFSVYAFAGGAETVTSMDSSGPALEQVARNLALNGFGDCESELMEEDVFTALRKFRDSRRSFDVIILDPPKFAPTIAQAERAARGYKDINLLAFKLLKPGGVLFTFSCSGGVSRDLFQKIVAGAAQDAGVEARILAQLSQSPDHPIALNFPEGMYLKGLVCSI
ncbi:MAG: class I SAM-dependent rRNA methyltransferase [Anaerolineaceae bacterium]